MSRDELIEELKKFPPGEVNITVISRSQYVDAIHAKVLKVVMVPSPFIEVYSDE